MPTFDGNNLIITLDAGVTEVDVINDIYEAWKDWMLVSPLNRGYPQAFVSDGGNPLSSIINQGSYIFLRNDYGWRIRPPEEDTTIYLTGNLAVSDTTLPAFISTVGTYTAALLGLQPITQGVTESMATQLEANVFQGAAVCIDVLNGYPGTGYINGNPIGTRQAPSDNMVDTHTILMTRGLRNVNVMSSMPIDNIDLSDGHSFLGDSPFLTLTINPSADVTNCDIHNLTVVGELDGLNVIRDCSIGAVTNVSGIFEKCAFTSTVQLNGDTFIFESYSQIAGGLYPAFDVGSNDITFRNYRGSAGLQNAQAGHLSSCGIYGGRFIAEASCIGGEIHVRGDPYEILDDSGVGCTILTETTLDNRNVLTVPKFIGLK